MSVSAAIHSALAAGDMEGIVAGAAREGIRRRRRRYDEVVAVIAREGVIPLVPLTWMATRRRARS